VLPCFEVVVVVVTLMVTPKRKSRRNNNKLLESVSKKNKNRLFGSGLLNWAINNLPMEMHLPGGYQFCGPGTRLEQRLAQGQQGINRLDALCREHDIAYSRQKGVPERNEADRRLQAGCQQIISDPSTGLAERLAAKLVARVMQTKQHYGI
jgi:hypothetical protein